MTTIAYLYSDPLLESPPRETIWDLEIDRVYQDLGKRQELLKLIEDCRKEPPKYLLIRSLEELGDSLIEISDRLCEIESLGIEIIATEQPYSSSLFNKINPNELRGNLAKLLEEIENKKRSLRIRQGHARNRLKTVPPPGKAPYGYRKGKERYIIDRSTAPVIKDFFERFLLFGSLRGAVRYLEKRYGKKVSVSTGRRWLSNPVYRGDLIYQNNQIISDTHVPIISREEGAQIDRLLRRNGRLPSRTASAPRSLAGLVVCQHCQSSMTISRVTIKRKKQEYLYLRPINCTRVPKCRSIPYQEVLDMTIKRICADLPVAVAQIPMGNLDGVKTSLGEEIGEKEKFITQLSNLQEQGILDEETVQLRSYKLRSEIAQIKAKLAELPPVNLTAIAQAVSIPQFWLDLSETERRFYFREFIRQIEIAVIAHHEWEIRLLFIF